MSVTKRIGLVLFIMDSGPGLSVTEGHRVLAAELCADLANLLERHSRMACHITILEKRLSASLGEAGWPESGLGAPSDIDTLQRQISELEHRLHDLQQQLNDRTDELEAARSTNRELMAALNRG